MVQGDYANTPVAAAGIKAPGVSGARTSQPTLAVSPSNNSGPNVISP